MPSSPRILAAVSCLIVTCAILCVGQAEEGVNGHVFHNDAIGLTYTFPEKFSAEVENEIQFGVQDPTGREHLILALWDTSERTGYPQLAFLYDRKVRPAGLSRREMAERYLAAARQLWVSVPGAKISTPKQISPAGYAIWRLDLWQPDDLPQYNSVVVIPLADRRILAIQVNAVSQSELDAEVDSLWELHLGRKQP